MRAQDQVQVYIEEIIRENPAPSLETGLRTSCEGLTGSDCTAKKYCDLQCGSCKLSCSLFKRGRCDDTNYCTWTVDNKCVCSGAAPVTPTCSDSETKCNPDDNTIVQTCSNGQWSSTQCGEKQICSSRTGSEPYSCLGIAGNSCTSDDDCAKDLTCESAFPKPGKNCK